MIGGVQYSERGTSFSLIGFWFDIEVSCRFSFFDNDMIEFRFRVGGDGFGSLVGGFD